MKDCIFCKIVKGEVPSEKVYEDKDFIAIMDTKPLTKGNSLIIPKKHYRWVCDVPNFGDYFEVAKEVGLATQKAFGAEWICFLTLGWEVPHAHIRVIPRYKTDPHDVVVDINRYEEPSQKELSQTAKEITKHIHF